MKNRARLLARLIIILAFISSSLIVLASEGATFALRPVNFDPNVPATQSYFVFDAQLGSLVHGEVRVTNLGAERGTVQLYAVDATTGQTSGTVFMMKDNPKQAAGTWITLDVEELTLEGGENRVVPFTVAVPSDAKSGHHVAGIIAESVELRESNGITSNGDATSFQVTIQNRIAVAVQVNLPGEKVKQVDLLGVTAAGQQGYQTLLLHLRNSGTLMVKPQGMLIIRDEQGQPLQDLPIKLDTFLPATEIQYPVFVEQQALMPGNYTAELTLLYDSPADGTYEAAFTVTEAQFSQVFEGREALTVPETVAATGVLETAPPWTLIMVAVGILIALLLLALIILALRQRPAQS